MLLAVTIDGGNGNGNESLQSGGREAFGYRKKQRQMHLGKCGDWRRGSMVARALTVVRGDVVLLLLCPTGPGRRRTLSVAELEAEANREVGANSEEVK